jgi:DNA polymerase/3'-5' exonuclease PolX
MPETTAQIARKLAAIIGQGARGARLARELARDGVRSRADLKRILARLPIEARANVIYNPFRGATYNDALAVANEFTRRATFGVARFEVIPVGSVRRKTPRVNDLDFLVIAPSGANVLDSLSLRRRTPRDRISIATVYAAGPRRRSVILRVDGLSRARHYRADVFLATTAEKPFALLHYTGPYTYNIRIRAHAKRNEWLLNQYGLFNAISRARVRRSNLIHSERDLTHHLGVTYRAPHNREDAT